MTDEDYMMSDDDMMLEHYAILEYLEQKYRIPESFDRDEEDDYVEWESGV